MKKEIIAAAAVVMLFALCSCSSGGGNHPGKTTEETYYSYTDAERQKIVSSVTPYRTALTGYVGERIALNEKWLCRALNDNPYIIEAIENRNSSGGYDVVTWYGEFPGALLYGMAECYKLTGSAELLDAGNRLVSRLSEVQSDDGYLGILPDGREFDQSYWDVGAHFFIMQGLIDWYEVSGNENALNVSEKAAGAVYRYRITEKKPISAGQLMVITPVAKLYLINRDPCMEELARNLSDLADACCGFFRGGLSGTDFYRLPVHRWENMFDIKAYSDLAQVFGDDRYLTSMLNHWSSLRKTDRHTTGGMTTGETTVGTPFTNGPIETCASVLWEDFSAACYAVLPLSDIADELELTFFNAILGAQLEDGRFTYDTPRSGQKIPSDVELSWQATPRSKDFNCCSANAARGIGLLSEWSMFTDSSGLRVNYYGPGVFITSTPERNPVRLVQETAYPADGAVKLTVYPEKNEAFPIMLRIPSWAEGSRVRVNDGEYVSANAGAYHTITREWKNGDTIELELSMNIHFTDGEGIYSGKAAMYYGPLLLAVDEEYNRGWNGVTPDIDREKVTVCPADTEETLFYGYILTAGGVRVNVCDFASCGRNGSRYTTWFRTS